MRTVLLCLFSLLVSATAAPRDGGEGREIMLDLVARVPTRDREIMGLLKIRDASGARTELPIKLEITRKGEEVWQDRYHTPGDAKIPAQILTITHFPGLTNRYQMEGSQVVGGPFQSSILTGTNIFSPFATSDFWVADWGLEFFHWPEQTVIKREMRKGRSCRVVESRNPNPASTTYSRVLSWIDYETGNLIRAEAFDSRGKLLKKFSVRSIKKVDGRWQVKELEIENEQTGSQTILHFTFEMTE
ncbi:MAG: outer membrane lipoprotein-sorting protein [Verrucomicrobiota bacterium]|nr:outer membrane lipoprotein-sorting protein [Verrucomicrobiota bacterium]